ncbi:hypothetical protein HAX54_029446 [Datura stramonium]|uniref:Uncharacterized protein n=1 Tax=Datura stramonium TaxID=4076 RepID=A0ABS8V680_DATST|nr:hypothetical protein [Datura stramonium]
MEPSADFCQISTSLKFVHVCEAELIDECITLNASKSKERTRVNGFPEGTLSALLWLSADRVSICMGVGSTRATEASIYIMPFGSGAVPLVPALEVLVCDLSIVAETIMSVRSCVGLPAMHECVVCLGGCFLEKVSIGRKSSSMDLRSFTSFLKALNSTLSPATSPLPPSWTLATQFDRRPIASD